VLAVGLVTGMVFWMRRAAVGLSAHLRGEVERAVMVGVGALTVTAFLAVGREGWRPPCSCGRRRARRDRRRRRWRAPRSASPPR
jgi:iron permease FTR1 family protein